MLRQIFLDTETTGLSVETGDRIIEVGCIEMENRRLTGRNLHQYVNPARSSDPEALRIHGLTDEFLADKPAFAAIADELLAYLAGAEVLMHNAPFDTKFLNAELRRIGKPPIEEVVAEITDTASMARAMFPGKRSSLDALCSRLEVDNTNRTLHGALLDAGLLAEVYIRLTRGQDMLAIDAIESAGEGGLMHSAVDLAAFDLLVIEPDAAEQRAHEAVLADVDKASGGKAIWRVAVA